MLVVLITLTATFFIQLGYFSWKVAADQLPHIGKDRIAVVVRGFLSSKTWLLGTTATTLGWLLFIKATDLGQISIVQPLMSVGDVFFILLAVIFLHERLVRSEWFGLAVTVLGAITLASEASVIPPADIIWPRLWVFLSLATVIFYFGMLAARRGGRAEIPLAIAVGIGFGVGAVLTELMTAYLSFNHERLESLAVLLNPILPFMLLANIAGLIVLQMAFQRGKAALIVPVQLSIANGVVVVAGVLVFSEAISISRAIGIALVLIGTALLHVKSPRANA